MIYQVEVNSVATFWKLDGKYHREDGPSIEYSNGDRYWYLNGKHHREDGPAIEFASGNKSWYLNGKLHREDGPAIEFSDGTKRWCLNGVRYSEEEFIQRMNPVKELTVEEIVKILGYEVKITNTCSNILESDNMWIVLELKSDYHIEDVQTCNIFRSEEEAQKYSDDVNSKRKNRTCYEYIVRKINNY